MNPYETLLDAINNLKVRGFREEFTLTESGIYCQSSGKNFTPNELEIEEYYRFEGMSYPGDNEIVYALQAKDNSVRGILVCPYGGAYADSASGQLMAQLSMKPAVSNAA